MTQEDKQLLLKDLCGRLPYGVKGLAYAFGDPCNINTNINGVINKCIVTDYESYMLELIKLSSEDVTIKPYLRSMSSMTEEEKHDYYMTYTSIKGVATPHPYKTTDWLNENHFDYRGLVEKGLAIEVTEDMYRKGGR